MHNRRQLQLQRLQQYTTHIRIFKGVLMGFHVLEHHLVEDLAESSTFIPPGQRRIKALAEEKPWGTRYEE